MKITPRYVTALKWAGLIVLIMSIYNFLLTYFGMSGISISHPEENSALRHILNNLKMHLATIALWVLIGYLTKDYKSAIAALVVTVLLRYGVEALSPRTYTSGPPKQDLKHFLIPILYVLPPLTFGFLHFKNTKAFKFILYWALMFGLVIALNPGGLERILSSITRIFGFRDLFELRISTGESSYRTISIFRIFGSEFFLIVRLTVFWWIYEYIKSDRPFFKNLNTVPEGSINNRLAFSVFYWGFRIILWIIGIGLISYIGRGFRMPFDIVAMIRILFCMLGIVVAGSIYRNILIAHFVDRNKYPNWGFFLLNIPIINFFTWLQLLINFNHIETKIASQEHFSNLKNQFIHYGKNSVLKVVIILISVFSMLYQLNRAGFRIDGPSRDGALMLCIVSLISLGFIIWFLSSKHAYIPLLVMSAASIFATMVIREEAFLVPTMASSIVNLVIYYGLFHFDDLKLSSVSATQAYKDSLKPKRKSKFVFPLNAGNEEE